MTFYDFGIGELKKRGLFDNMAVAVMDEVVKESQSNTESLNRPMYDRWDDNVDDYPEMLKILLFDGVQPFALEYIKKNCPKAWFRPIFDNDHPLRKAFDAKMEKREPIPEV